MLKSVIISVCLSFILFGFINVESFQKANDLIVGNLTANNTNLYTNSYNISGIIGQTVTRDVVYNGLANYYITRVRALDLALNGTGGFGYIISGGVGYNNVTIRLTSSAPGRGFYFYVDIYGRNYFK